MSAKKAESRPGERKEQISATDRLLVLLLLKLGATQDEIASALQTSQASVSRMFSGLKVKKLELP